jgi:hypothetical protein
VLVFHRGFAMPAMGDQPVTLDTHTAYSTSTAQSEAADADSLGLYPNWSERVVTVVAASLAVLVVALIAIVMGMA